jgi:hypothetical protein
VVIPFAALAPTPEELLSEGVWKSVFQPRPVSVVVECQFLPPSVYDRTGTQHAFAKFRPAMQGIPGSGLERSACGGRLKLKLSYRPKKPLIASVFESPYVKNKCQPLFSIWGAHTDGSEANWWCDLNPKDIEFNKLRLTNAIQPPRLLKLIWCSPLLCAAALASWYVLCSLGIAAAPIYLFLAVSLNGVLEWRARRAHFESGTACLVYTEEVTENEIMPLHELLMQMTDILFTIQTAVGTMAGAVEGFGFLVSGGDLLLSTIFYLATGVLCLLLSLVFALIPVQTIIFWIGALALVGGHIAYPWIPSVTQLVKDDLEAKRAVCFGLTAQEDTKKRFETEDGLGPESFLKRIPDNLEMWHRYIADRIQLRRPLEYLEGSHQHKRLPKPTKQQKSD